MRHLEAKHQPVLIGDYCTLRNLIAWLPYFDDDTPAMFFMNGILRRPMLLMGSSIRTYTDKWALHRTGNPTPAFLGRAQVWDLNGEPDLIGFIGALAYEATTHDFEDTTQDWRYNLYRRSR